MLCIACLSILVLIIMSMSIMSLRPAWVLSAIAGGMFEHYISYSKLEYTAASHPGMAATTNRFLCNYLAFDIQSQPATQPHLIFDQTILLLGSTDHFL